MSVISVNEWFNESIRLFDGKRSTGQSFVEQHQERIFNPFPVHVHDLVDVVVDVTCEPHGDRLGQVTQSTDHDSNGSEADESHRLDSLLHLFLSIVWIIGINRCLTVLYLDNWSQNLDLREKDAGGVRGYIVIRGSESLWISTFVCCWTSCTLE